MAQKQRLPEKPKTDRPASAAQKATSDMVRTADEDVIAAEPSTDERPTIVSSAVAIVASPSSGAKDETTIDFDLDDLPLKTLDFLAENVFAFLDYAAELSKASSLTDVIEAQSRFTRERYSTFFKQINEAADIARHLSGGAGFSIHQSFAI
jgi:hypothetical protein